MSDEVYKKLAKVLDTLPNGFPSTPNGVEIKLLRKIFMPEQAELFCNLRMTFETAEQIAERAGRPLSGLEEQLTAMDEAGQLQAVQLGETKFFRMVPWAFGIYEFQLHRLDRELAELCEEFLPFYHRQFCSNTPQLMQVLPIEKEIAVQQESLPYERVSALIDRNEAFLVNECICKKEKGLLGKPCEKPLHVCLAMAPFPGVFDKSPYGRVITKPEAYELLKASEDAGLVHLTANVQNGRIYICNCCGCCCGVLRSITDLGIPASHVVNSLYYAEIDPEMCSGCGICLDERCQVVAIEETENEFRIIRERCIGCGLCISKCPQEAIRLVHKEEAERIPPPVTEDAWFEERGRIRGIDYSPYK
jgi:electron transport complex protein RnfB